MNRARFLNMDPTGTATAVAPARNHGQVVLHHLQCCFPFRASFFAIISRQIITIFIVMRYLNFHFVRTCILVRKWHFEKWTLQRLIDLTALWRFKVTSDGARLLIEIIFWFRETSEQKNWDAFPRMRKRFTPWQVIKEWFTEFDWKQPTTTAEKNDFSCNNNFIYHINDCIMHLWGSTYIVKVDFLCIIAVCVCSCIYVCIMCVCLWLLSWTFHIFR